MTSKYNRRSFLQTAATAGGAMVFGFSRGARAAEGDSITQTARFRLNPEKADEAVALLEELCGAVEEHEPGVLAYICHRSAADPSELLFFEVYENGEALMAHGQTEHLGKLRMAFGQGVFLPLSAETPLEIVRLNRVAGFSR